MASPTKEDEIGASNYAFQFILKYRYEIQDSDKRWSLPRYYMIRRPVVDEFHVPPEITDAEIIELKFGEISCSQLSCYPFRPGNNYCTKDTEPLSFVAANKTFNACQKSCFKYVRDGHSLIWDTKFTNGSCRRVNTIFKRWCVDPDARSDEPQHVPAFEYDESSETCNIPPEYCNWFTLDWKEGECHRSGGQEFLEDYIFGRTIYRSLVRLSKGEPVNRLSKLVQENHPLLEMLKGFLFDLSIPVSINILNHISVKLLLSFSRPATLALLSRLGSQYGIAVARMATVSAALKTVQMGIVASSAIKAGAIMASAASVVGWALLGVTITGLILDLVDPLKLNGQMTMDLINDIKKIYDMKFNHLISGEHIITPMFLMEQLWDGNPDQIELEILITKMAEYYNKLVINSEGHGVHSFEEFQKRILDSSQNYALPEQRLKIDKYFSIISFVSAILIPIFLIVSL